MYINIEPPQVLEKIFLSDNLAEWLSLLTIFVQKPEGKLWQNGVDLCGLTTVLRLSWENLSESYCMYKGDSDLLFGLLISANILILYFSRLKNEESNALFQC